jgi:hypothetical protein
MLDLSNEPLCLFVVSGSCDFRGLVFVSSSGKAHHEEHTNTKPIHTKAHRSDESSMFPGDFVSLWSIVHSAVGDNHHNPLIRPLNNIIRIAPPTISRYPINTPVVCVFR